jgi:hypothetical protein
VPGHLLLKNCVEDEPTRPAIERAMKDDSLLWLDLADSGPDTLALLRDVFNIHPLAVEDAQEFNQRPKVEDYEDFVYLVAYGSLGLDQPFAEVHCFYAEHFFVTVHRDEIPAIADACTALNRLYTDRRLVALYRLLDALVDSMFPFLAALDDRIDELQDRIFAKPTEDQLAALFGLKRQLVDMRKLVTPQRDMVASMLTQVVPIPGMTAESERYVRDLYDHLIRISDTVDSQPAQRRDEAADHHRHRVPAAVLPDRVLRPEPGLAGGPRRLPGRVSHLRHRYRVGRRTGPALHVPPARLAVKTFYAERAVVRPAGPVQAPRRVVPEEYG